MVVLYQNPCYSEGCYNEVELYSMLSAPGDIIGHLANFEG